MVVFFIDVKQVVDVLNSEVDVTLPKNIIMYYIVQNLPKEYEMFKHMLFIFNTCHHTTSLNPC